MMQNLPQVAFFVYVMYTVSVNISESVCAGSFLKWLLQILVLF